MNAKTKKNVDTKHEYVSGRKGQTFLQVAQGEFRNILGPNCLLGRYHRHSTSAITIPDTIKPAQAALISERICKECVTIEIDLPKAARIYNEMLEYIRTELRERADSLTLKVEV